MLYSVNRIFLKNLVWVFWAEEVVLDLGCKAEILRRKIVLRAQILQDLNVQQQRCENILKFGSQHFDQCDPELS
jgi:hypothetical protein